MRKISYKVFQNMIAAKLSSLEIDFLLTIAKCQSESGRVTGVYYRDICEEIECSYQQFYNLLRSLSQKGIISYKKASYYDYDITILDNSLSCIEERRQGYISLSKEMYCKEFQKLRAGSKILAMELLRRQEIQFKKIQKPSLCFKKSTLYERFGNLLGVTKRVLLYYLKELKAFFAIGMKEGKFYITPLKRSYSEQYGASDTALLQENDVRACCRRHRIDPAGYSIAAVRDTARLITQYAQIALERGMNAGKVVMKTICDSVDKSSGYTASKRELQPPLIHRLLRQTLDSYIIPEGCEA